ncbi:hypothetical protein CNY89_02100 [Amaricoccus sp. HAR-UPW-R2A-40]|nr:hypothetical protein CNY89_02100 [Amaricoccus sp. HAR-UPW-R2A-40]
MPLIAKIEHYEDRARFCLEEAIFDMRRGNFYDGAGPMLEELKATVDMLYDVYEVLYDSMPWNDPANPDDHPSAVTLPRYAPQPAALPPS